MGRLGQDLRYALRTGLRTRSVSILAIVAFALGIGVTTAVFSIFNGVLLAPLPFPDPDQLVAVYGTQPACATCPASFPKYHDWKTRNQVFAAMGGSTQASFVMTGLGSAEQISGIATTASLNEVFRVAPQLGRWYTEQEDQAGDCRRKACHGQSDRAHVAAAARARWRRFGANSMHHCGANRSGRKISRHAKSTPHSLHAPVNGQASFHDATTPRRS